MSPLVLPARSAPLLGSRIGAFGHSYMAGGGSSSVDKCFINTLPGLTKGHVENQSVGASLLGNDEAGSGKGGWAYILQQQTPYRTSAPYVPNGYMMLLCYGINDIGFRHNDANARTVWKNGLRTAISRLSASRVFEETDSTVVFGGGTWQQAYVPYLGSCNSGLNLRPFPANAATFTITLPADLEDSYVAVGMTAFTNSDAVITWTGTCSSATGTTTLVGQASGVSPGGDASQRACPVGVVKRFAVLASDKSKTIIGTIGSMVTTALPASPTAAGVYSGTAGAAATTYQWVAGNQNGDGIPGTASASVAAEADPLTAANKVTVTAPVFPTGATYMRLVRATSTSHTGNSATLGVISTITTSAAVIDSGQRATAYTANTAHPLLTGGTFDYWQIEANNPTTSLIVCNVNRCNVLQGGYTGYPTVAATTAITAGGTQGTNTATVASTANITIGYPVKLTGGVAESIKVTNIVGLVLTFATNILQTGHTTCQGGFPGDPDVVNYNTDIASVVSEFLPTVAICDVDSVINADPTLYTDGVHLNDRGQGLLAQALLNTTQYLNGSQPISSLIHASREMRAPEHATFLSLETGDVTVSTTTWANVTGALLSLLAQPGDLIEVGLNGMASNTAQSLSLDVCSYDGANPLRYFSSKISTTAFGQGGWWCNASVFTPLSGSVYFVVVPSDLVVLFTIPGTLLIQLRGALGSAGTKVISASLGTWPLVMWAKNLGQPNGASYV